MADMRAREIYHDPQSKEDRKLILIESVESSHVKSNLTCQIYGCLAPLAVIVCTRDGIQLQNIEATNTDLDTLRRDIPELDKLLVTYLK
jgi:ATP-dependent exoDNAse (exonuclease V) alpha subunit